MIFTYTAKVVFKSDNYEVTPDNSGYKRKDKEEYFNLSNMAKLIEDGKVSIQVIPSNFNMDYQPTFIIEEKLDK